MNDDKLLVKFLGECWHNWEKRNTSGLVMYYHECSKCGAALTPVSDAGTAMALAEQRRYDIDLNDGRTVVRLFEKLWEVHGHVEVLAYAYGICVRLGCPYTKFNDNVTYPSLGEAIRGAVLAMLKEPT